MKIQYKATHPKWGLDPFPRLKGPRSKPMTRQIFRELLGDLVKTRMPGARLDVVQAAYELGVVRAEIVETLGVDSSVTFEVPPQYEGLGATVQEMLEKEGLTLEEFLKGTAVRFALELRNG